LKIISLKRVSYRPFYDSKWCVVLEIVGETHEVYIVRDDDETEQSLREELQKCKSIKDVSSLDKRSTIYYD